MKLKGKVALITGGGTGIGRETALLFAQQGAAVAVNYSSSEKEALDTKSAIEGLGVPGAALKADISQNDEVRNMVDTVQKQFGRIDILVNNAGTTSFVPLEDLEGMTDEQWDRIFAVNVKGTFNCSRAVIPIMESMGSGAIINIASIAGMIGTGSSIAYCASKAGVISITKSLAKACAPHIRVNAIAPGFVETRWTEGKDDFRNVSLKSTPMKRVAVPKDIADVALFLAVDTGFVTGQIIVVDGGKTM